MLLQRGELCLQTGKCVTLAKGQRSVELDEDELRWLVLVAGPTAVSANMAAGGDRSAPSSPNSEGVPGG